jgi:ATP-binding cassette subfamily B protein
MMLKATRVIAGNLKRLLVPSLLRVLLDIAKVAPFVILYYVAVELFAPVEAIDTGKITWLIVLMFGILIVQLVVSTFSYRSEFVTAYDLSSDARLRLGEHLRKLPLGFFKRRDPGDITALMLQDMGNVEHTFSHLFFEVIGAIVVPTLIAIILFFVDWRLTLLMLAAAAVALPLLVLGQKVVKYFGEKQVSARNDATSRMLEYLEGIKDIKAFNLAGDKFSRLESTFDRLRRESIRLEAGAAPPGIAYRIVLETGLIAVLLLGNYYLFGGSLAVTAFILFLIIGYQFFQPLMDIGLYTAEMRYMNIAAERIVKVLDSEPLPEPEDDPGLESFGIEFENVTFSYLDTDVLKDVSFEVPERSMTALVGPSGSGKTTVTNLIARFWDVDSGRVKVGGTDVKDIPSERLLSDISMVFQNVYLFNDTIYDNIKIGREDATRDEVVAAATAAQCHEFILELSLGYDTVVGEGGSTLSEGEKQRISIARAILKDAPIVLLDEATASVDPEKEIYIQRAINELVKSKTLVVIAHRLSTITGADQIVVLDHGRVVERGRHSELVEAGGLYSRFWEEQKRAKGWKFSSGRREPVAAGEERSGP